jgi:hypothetical protein
VQPLIYIQPVFISHDPVRLLRDEITSRAKGDQPSRNAPKPCQVTIILLTRYPNVHAPHAGDDIHGQDDSAYDSQLAENVRVLLRPLVHADVDLSDVVAVGSAEETTFKCQRNNFSND